MHLDTKILLIRIIDILNCFNPVMPTLKVDFTNPEYSFCPLPHANHSPPLWYSPGLKLVMWISVIIKEEKENDL